MSEANLGSTLTNYWRQAGEKIRHLYDSLSLKNACCEIAEYHIIRANSFSFVVFRTGERRDLTDVSGSGKDLIKIEDVEDRKFAVDKDGIFVGIVEGNDYYELEPDRYVNTARKYRGFEKSLLRRLLNFPEIKLYSGFGFPIKKSLERCVVGFGSLLYLCVKAAEEEEQGEHNGDIPKLEQKIQNSLGAQNEENNE